MIPDRIKLNRWRKSGWIIYGEGTEDLWMERDIWAFGPVNNWNPSTPVSNDNHMTYQQIVRIGKGQWASVSTEEILESAAAAMHVCGKELKALRIKYKQVIVRPPARPVI